MASLVQARLINGPFGDPGVLVDFRFGRRAILLDLGDLAPLSAREILRVTDILVSHAHMDHFAGFGRVLRLRLNRPEPVRIFGPPGIADRVHHQLASYTWNLLGEHSPDFAVVVAEFDGTSVTHSVEFRARNVFARVPMDWPPAPPGTLIQEPDFTVTSVMLDHNTPVLAFALQESMRVNVWTEGLDALGLPVGPWLNEAKRLVRQGAAPNHPVAIPGREPIPLEALTGAALRVAPGLRIAYVTDAVFSPANERRIGALAAGADHLFIEAGFLDEDAEIARERWHLTAGQAGRMARAAGASRVTPFHFSPRYLGREDELRRELAEAFGH